MKKNLTFSQQAWVDTSFKKLTPDENARKNAALRHAEESKAERRHKLNLPPLP